MGRGNIIGNHRSVIMLNREIVYHQHELEQVARELIEGYPDKRIFCFKGDLGTGKTTLISAICKHLGSVSQVSSPTFALVNAYNTKNGELYHFDLYRLNNMEEIMDIGFEEYLYSGSYCFIEWPEKITDILPMEQVITCKLSYLGPDQRKLTICAA